MADKTNSGHAKNVANLAILNQTINGFGEAYNPANEQLGKEALLQMEARAKEKLNNVDDFYVKWKNATNEREIAFKDLDKTITRCLANLKSFPVAQQTIDDAMAIAAILRNQAKPKKTKAAKTDPAAAPPPATNSVSTAKTSYDARTELFGKLALILQKEPLYKSNDPEYNNDGLLNKCNWLASINNNAKESLVLLTSARIERNLFFYKKQTGVLDTVKLSKAYVKNLFGAKSLQYKTVSSIRFTRLVSTSKAI